MEPVHVTLPAPHRDAGPSRRLVVRAACPGMSEGGGELVVAAYEAVFILRPDLDEDGVSKVSSQVASVIQTNQGLVSHLEKVGHRRLAYEVKGYTEGIYVILHYEGEPIATRELERFFKISDDVIRHLVVKKESRAKKDAKLKKETKASDPGDAGSEEGNPEPEPGSGEPPAAEPE